MITVFGINHTTAAVAARERVAFAPERLAEALQDGCRGLGSGELVILSTCNRTELYFPSRAAEFYAERRGGDGALGGHGEAALSWLAGYHRIAPEELRELCYCFSGRRALEHLIQVASGLDSMVLGEPQIFGQMKSAYAVAAAAGTAGGALGQLFPRAFAVAKRVRTDTAIGENPVSVAYAAVELAGRIFADLSRARALLVGAGETIDLVARHLADTGVARITVAGRTLSRARELARRFGAKAVLLADIPEQLAAADIVISSTGSQLPILGKGAVEQALRRRKRRPMLMVDLAVPRDIEAQAGELEDIYLYTVDDLHAVVEENRRGRQGEARKADEIIAAGAAAIHGEWRGRDGVNAVKALRDQAEGMRDVEIAKARRTLARGAPAEEVLLSMAHALTNKLIHHPCTELKRAGSEGRQDVVRAGRRLLGLPNGGENSGGGNRGECSGENRGAGGGGNSSEGGGGNSNEYSGEGGGENSGADANSHAAILAE